MRNNYNVIKLSLMIMLVFFSFSCKEDLYLLKPNQTSQGNQVMSMPDSVRTLVALTPMTGPNADSLLSLKDFVHFQSTNNYSQSLPSGIDVVYINTDYPVKGLDESPLKEDINKRAILLIDGSEENMRTFIDKYLLIGFPRAQMIAYRPPASIETNIRESAESTTPPTETDPPVFETITFGRAQEDNQISKGMLLLTLWGASIEELMPAPTEEENLIDDNPIERNSARLNITTSGCISGNLINTNGGAFKSAASPISLSAFDSPIYYEGQGMPGCHFINEYFDDDREFYCWDYGAPTDYFGDKGNPPKWKRQACWDSEDLQGGQIAWSRAVVLKESKPKMDILARSSLVEFDSKTCLSCYLDLSVTRSKSKTYKQSWTKGKELGVALGPIKTSISKSYMKGVSQTAATGSAVQREFWVTKNMLKKGTWHDGKWVIKGQAFIKTSTRWNKGYGEYNLRIRYLTDGAMNGKWSEKFIEYCYRGGGNAEFTGDYRNTKFLYFSTAWYDKFMNPIKTFAN